MSKAPTLFEQTDMRERIRKEINAWAPIIHPDHCHQKSVFTRFLGTPRKWEVPDLIVRVEKLIEAEIKRSGT